MHCTQEWPWAIPQFGLSGRSSLPITRPLNRYSPADVWLDVSGVKLVACTRNPFAVHELIRDGRFGRELGHGRSTLAGR
jgi:hypothetical protein